MYDLVVIGAGSGGIGAAISAGRAGLRTLWVEKEARLGGTGVQAFVNVWQPAYSSSVLAAEIAERLFARGAAVYSAPDYNTPSGRPLYPAVTAAYADTLRRWTDRSTWLLAPGLVYTPEGMDGIVRELAAETGNIELRTETVLVDARTEPSADGLRRITAVTLHGPQGVETVAAGHFIDAGADLPLALRAGCATAIGRDAQEDFGEPSAPPVRTFELNGWTLCFFIQPGSDRVALPAEGWGHAGDWAHIGEMPGGGYYVNMVLQLPGEAGWMLRHEQAREYLLRNITQRWRGVQKAYGLEGYGITALAPRIGVREGPRLLARYMLTEGDYLDGNFGAQHPDCIAFSDHALDRHSPDGGCREAPNGPVGIPFRCLQPRTVDNLLVACRGAGFTSLAASAARLQRTMIELGEAAAAYLAQGKVVLPARPPYLG